MAFEIGHHTIVGARLGDPYSRPVPGSGVVPCELCLRDVVISPLCLLRHNTEGLSVVCVECFATYRDAGHRVVLRFEPDGTSEMPWFRDQGDRS